MNSYTSLLTTQDTKLTGGFYRPERPMRSIIPPSPSPKLLSLPFHALRIGLALRLVGLVVMYGGFLLAGGGGSSLFSYTFIGIPEDVAQESMFLNGLAIGTCLFLAGTLYLSCFQIFLSDDTAWSCGFRAGSKQVGFATTLDLVGAIIEFVLIFRIVSNYSPQLLAQFSNGGSEWLLTSLAQLLSGVAALMYAQGFFLIEAYHDVGTSDLLGLLVASLYVFAGLAGICGLGFMSPMISPILLIIATAVSFTWALAFEAQLNTNCPQLHETELTNEIEAQIEEYARQAAVE